MHDIILITGATGMLGQHLYKELEQTGKHKVIPIGRTNSPGFKNFIQCDLAQNGIFNTILNKIRPTCVVHCAANVSIEDCEKKREETYALHVGTSEIIASKEYIERTLFISTDSVFDGKEGGYKEDSTKAPLNYYAKTKSQAEDIILNSACNPAVIRTNIIGYQIPFKQSLFEWGYNSLKEGKRISGFSNVYFNPLYVKTLAKLLSTKVMFNDQANGVYHFGSKDSNSKYNFLLILAEIFGLDTGLISEVKSESSVLRPLNTALNTDKAKRELSIQFPTLREEVLAIHQDLQL